MKYKFIITIFVLLVSAKSSYADYPNTSIGVIDLNIILTESKAAISASEQIETIAIDIENEIKESDESIIKEQNLLIESQAIMAPEAFEAKVQNYNVERQSKLRRIDDLIALSRNDVLNAIKPILEEISNKKGITILLEKNSVMLSADKMDITNEVLKQLNKELPQLKVSRD